jgi:hypothetical protein
MLPPALVSNGNNNAGNSSIRRLCRSADSRQREGREQVCIEGGRG